MSLVETLSIALPPEMAAQVRQAVDTGEYASSSDVIRDALRGWSHKRQLRQNDMADLRTLWQQARADTSPGLDPDDVFGELERKYRAIADAVGSGA